MVSSPAAPLQRVLHSLYRVSRFIVLATLLGWASLAIYFSNLPWPVARSVLALAFAAFGIWSLWFARDSRFVWLFAVLYSAVLIWWRTILPSHDRQWRPEVAVMPDAALEGDRLTLSGVRNFDYHGRDDFDVRYETREVSLSHVTGVDFFISYWMPGPVGHTFLSFDFDNALPVSISIEARPELTEGYAVLASLFKQFELIYVVGDERDIVRARTNYRGEDVYLYRLNVTPENARRLLLVYARRIHELADKPEFYHLLSNNCTVNILRYANAAGRQGRLDIRHVLNGLIDGYLYNTERLNTSLPLAELRARSHINAAAQAAGDSADFSARIRAGLPTPE